MHMFLFNSRTNDISLVLVQNTIRTIVKFTYYRIAILLNILSAGGVISASSVFLTVSAALKLRIAAPLPHRISSKKSLTPLASALTWAMHCAQLLRSLMKRSIRLTMGAQGRLRLHGGSTGRCTSRAPMSETRTAFCFPESTRPN